MIKTQVQIPDGLHADAKRVAAEYEMSFAEVVRRGLERVLQEYPPRSASGDWKFPSPRKLGCRPYDDEDLKRFAQEDEPVL